MSKLYDDLLPYLNDNYSSIAQDWLQQERKLTNIQNAIYIPRDAQILNHKLNAGILLPIDRQPITEKTRAVIFREIQNKQFYKIMDAYRYPFLYNQTSTYNETVIVCEGAFDAEAIIQSGHNNVIATLGTVTQEVLLSLSIYKHIITMFDNDDTGYNNHKKLETFIQEANLDIELDIIDYRGAKDPNEYLAKFGNKQLYNVIQDSLLW